MSGLLVAALAWSAVLPVAGLALGRALRAADQRNEALRHPAPVPATSCAADRGRPIAVEALGALS